MFINKNYNKRNFPLIDTGWPYQDIVGYDKDNQPETNLECGAITCWSILHIVSTEKT